MPDTAVRTFEDIERTLRDVLGDDLASSEVIEKGGGQLIVRTAPARRIDALTALKGAGYTFYTFCCAVDWPDEERMEVLDHVYAPPTGRRVTVKYDLPRAEPRLPSGVSVYAGSDWYERETWELFGVVFAGHPRLRRLFLPDWFEGFPMRKDYDLPARVEKPWPGDFFSG